MSVLLAVITFLNLTIFFKEFQKFHFVQCTRRNNDNGKTITEFRFYLYRICMVDNLQPHWYINERVFSFRSLYERY